MNEDDFDPLRRLRPDRIQPDDPGDPAVYSRAKEEFMSTIDQDMQRFGGGLTVGASLSEHPRLFVRQRFELGEMFGFESRNKYAVVSESGAQQLGPIAAELAYGEGLQAHARAAEMRLKT